MHFNWPILTGTGSNKFTIEITVEVFVLILLSLFLLHRCSLRSQDATTRQLAATSTFSYDLNIDETSNLYSIFTPLYHISSSTRRRLFLTRSQVLGAGMSVEQPGSLERPGWHQPALRVRPGTGGLLHSPHRWSAFLRTSWLAE